MSTRLTGPRNAIGAPEPAKRGRARRRWVRTFGIGVLIVVALGASALAWAFLPRSLGEVGVEAMRLEPAPTARDDGPAERSAPARIAVTFVVPEDLERVRARVGLGYVAARLADCRNGEADTLAVVAQRGEYLRDTGRVQRVGEVRGGVRYRAAFDDVLAEMIDHAARFTSAHATPGGLCFSLYGASMWFGWGRSNVVRLPLARLSPRVRTGHHPLQPLPSLGATRTLAASVRPGRGVRRRA